MNVEEASCDELNEVKKAGACGDSGHDDLPAPKHKHGEECGAWLTHNNS